MSESKTTKLPPLTEKMIEAVKKVNGNLSHEHVKAIYQALEKAL